MAKCTQASDHETPTTEACATDRLASQVTEIVEAEFDIGLVTRVEQLYGGYTNLSFSVSTCDSGTKHKIFFRKYWKGVTADTIEFEHALLGHMISRGAHSVAGVIRTKDGRGHVRRMEPATGGEQEYYFAAFQFIEGHDKYTWLKNEMSDEECASAGAVLGDLHNSSAGFSAEGLTIPRDSVLQIIPRLGEQLAECVSRGAGSRCSRYLMRNLDPVLRITERVKAELSLLPDLPTIGIHGDFHPGNQKYFDSRVVGVFDFDRASIDLRAFDVALAAIYFCGAWGGRGDGRIRLDTLRIFLSAYQRRAEETGPLGPMNAQELACLPAMLAAANLVLAKWATADTFFAQNSSCDDAEYLTYIQHHVRLARWIDANRERIAGVIASL